MAPSQGGRMIVLRSPDLGDRRTDEAAPAAKGTGAIMASLDTLATVGTELHAEQLEQVDGGLILILALAVFDIALYSYGIGTLQCKCH